MKQPPHARRLLLAVAALLLCAPGPALACGPEALGTARVMEIDPKGLRVGKKSFPDTLPLAPKEVVLTFDDGPWPTTTAAVLDALKAECVRATFFLIGENARARPQLVKRELAEGHTVAHHTMTHPAATLAKIPFDAAVKEIERGIAADDTAAYGAAGAAPRVPFFRFPGFASTPQLLAYLETKGIAVFGADLWASDWNVMTPEAELDLVMKRLDAAGGGIVLFHDTKPYTAAMIPAFLKALKRNGYSIVHMVPKA
ncbi:polysaccharide deacetylase family protein [Xanthobacter aminoxidans]|uniref:polysaccharide deacetylase family protein n=1 Tax=Xanthobacter aminoxidans TaxID=186280 RepID=UPI002022F79C|nr:polysaccharide deacetylase family protein [Xanthobacter aminoxidans]MCL8382010.1 polysaccharide deacetylase family protein [Xanthobacter aminoxidans]